MRCSRRELVGGAGAPKVKPRRDLQVQILVYLHTGNAQDSAKAEAKSALFAASHVDGMVMVRVADKPDYEGPYRAVVTVGGHAATHTDFTAMVDGGDC